MSLPRLAGLTAGSRQADDSMQAAPGKEGTPAWATPECDLMSPLGEAVGGGGRWHRAQSWLASQADGTPLHMLPAQRGVLTGRLRCRGACTCAPGPAHDLRRQCLRCAPAAGTRPPSSSSHCCWQPMTEPGRQMRM